MYIFMKMDFMRYFVLLFSLNHVMAKCTTASGYSGTP